MAQDSLAPEKKKEKVALGGLLGAVVKEREAGYDFLDMLETAERLGKEIAGAEVLEEGKGYKIVRKEKEKTPVYVVFLPSLTEEEKKILKDVKRRAISEIDIDPESILDKEKKKKTFIKEVLALMEAKYPSTPSTKQKAFAKLIVQDMIGYGLLEPLLLDDDLEEVMVLGTKKSVYVYHRSHGMCKTNITFETDEEAVNIIARIARAIGRRIDISSPLLDARLPDGSRVNATVPPASLDGPSLTIRKFKADPLTMVDILKFGTLSIDLAAFLWLVVEGYGVKPANILVSGGTGSGKTTTLNCLASFIPTTDRIISIEDTAELQLPIEHWIRLETRPPNIEGRGEVSMDMLLKNTLRMRPDRIIVGEVRGPEASTLLASMNTGQNGCLGTVHANTAKETITRLTSAPMNVPAVMIPSLNLILMQNKFNYKGKTARRITEIAEITGMERGKPKLSIIYEWDPKDDTVKPTGAPSMLKRRLAELRGVSLEEADKEQKKREAVLRSMIEKDTRSLKEVGRRISEYYLASEKRLEEVGEGGKVERKGTKEEKRAYGFLAEALGKKEEPSAKRVRREVIEQDSEHKLVKMLHEKNLQYIVSLPSLNRREKDILREIEKKAISEIEIDPLILQDKEKARQIITKKVSEIIERTHPEIALSKQGDLVKIIVQNMIGYGLLESFLADDNLEEIMVVGTGKNVYVNHRKYGACKTNIVFETDDDTIRIIDRIASSVGRRIDKATPLLDARLPDGSRVNATIPPISVNGPTLTIRKFKKDPLTAVDLINSRTLTTEVTAFLWLVVEGLGIKPGNILVAGGSSSGKTTTLNCLASFIPPTDRVITIEDTAELRLPIEHHIRLETRPPNVEGLGEVTMDDLVKNTLRMRPDRVIVGEVRGQEARTLFTAMNTGHDGCMGTIHSNSARETITRLVNPPMNVPEIMLPALDLILMEQKIYHKGATIRRITEIAEITGQEKEKLTLNNIYEWDPKGDTLKPTGIPSILKQRIAKLSGTSMKELNKELEKRSAVLEWMIRENITTISRVGEVINEYYSDTEKLLEEIQTKHGQRKHRT